MIWHDAAQPPTEMGNYLVESEPTYEVRHWNNGWADGPPVLRWCRIDTGGESFEAAVLERDLGNLQKWGKQTTAVLMLVLVEEIGEVARAQLESAPASKRREEIVDAAAVLRRMWHDLATKGS